MMTVICNDNRYLAGRLSHQHTYKPKTFSWSHKKLAKLCNESASRGTSLVARDGLRPHQLRYLAGEMAQSHSIKSRSRRHHHDVPLAATTWAGERAECQALARSLIRLPGEQNHPHTLSTSSAGGGRGVTTLPPGSTSLFDAANVSDSTLYEMGLLYDDANDSNSKDDTTSGPMHAVRSPRFGLNDITHDCPLYTLNVRPAKRSAREKRRVSDTGSDDVASEGLSDDAPPSPALSFYDVADDEALASFGMDPDDYVDLGDAWDEAA